ncbi:TetR family transcriptional regulator [Thalassobacillus devorans]|uniref:TetR family transcriptional regulator n=1 Tax=Thalassobacillus devorans TaxID=279813 RepID=A0ABQ1PVV5_9BACI|nr:TetR/AcrR family transcriptional regulator [Thalassobacillus devorans]NIK30846.1 AcrR family transcriptional regulator [Thalassobacillus devorans]GGD04735.1 TetR family transcriptional regulator [Thalassobacillus devorans]
MDEKDYLNQMIEAGGKDAELTPKQAKILEAAIEIFAERGYASTSTSEIAKKAGVAEGTIFRHYKTKKELLITIVKPVITKFAVPFFATHFVNQVFNEKTADYEELLRKIIRNRFEFAQKNVPLIKILLQEMAFHTEIQQSYQDVFKKEVFPRFDETIKHFQARGQLVNYPSEAIIRFTITTILGFLITRFIVMPKADWNDEAEINRTIHFLMNGLSKGNEERL